LPHSTLLFQDPEYRFDDCLAPRVGDLPGRTSQLGAHSAMSRCASPSPASPPEIQGARHIRIWYIAIDVVLLHGFQIVDREEPAVGKSLTGRHAAALLHLGQHALHRIIVGSVLRHPLGHDQVVVGNRNFRRVAEHELSSTLAQKARIFIAARVE
jgi:hypothetical protein